MRGRVYGVAGADNGRLQPYLDEISKHRTLSNEEEAHLARRIRKGDECAVVHLVRANLRFVINVARNYQNQGLPLSDLINEGNIGMIRAARRFDERKNFRFITYAVWWVRQSILRALADNSRVVKLPLNRVGILHRIWRTHGRLEQRLGRQPAADELAAELRMRSSDIGETVGAGAPAVSLDAPLGEDEGACLGDCLADGREEPVDERMATDAVHERIAQGLRKLDRREREILVMYYGFDGEEPYSLEEIGNRLHMTRERARQLKQRALNHLRRSSRPQLSIAQG